MRALTRRFTAGAAWGRSRAHVGREEQGRRRAPLALGVVGALGLLVLMASPVQARRVGVIGPLNPLGISRADARKVQRWVAAAASAVPGYRWRNASRLVRMLRKPGSAGCAARPDCLAAAARNIGADVVVTGDVGSLGGAFMVYLRAVTPGGSPPRSVSGVADPGKRGVRQAVRGLLFQLLAPGAYTGELEIEVDVPGAWIYLDGQRVGRGPRRTLRNVKVGTHALRVTHEDHRDFVRFVKVAFAEKMRVRVALSAIPVGSGRMRLVGGQGARPLSSSELPWYRRWWAVAGLGAVVFAATATTVALLLPRSVDRDSESVVPPAAP